MKGSSNVRLCTQLYRIFKLNSIEGVTNKHAPAHRTVRCLYASLFVPKEVSTGWHRLCGSRADTSERISSTQYFIRSCRLGLCVLFTTTCPWIAAEMVPKTNGARCKAELEQSLYILWPALHCRWHVCERAFLVKNPDPVKEQAEGGE